MSWWSRAWERTREPLPCQYERGVCIRCNQPEGSGFLWRCDVPLYGPGDVLFRITRLLDLKTCDPCHTRRISWNLMWYKLWDWLYTKPEQADS